jgi:glycosyltransferase involved in cell wall biosynthesis
VRIVHLSTLHPPLDERIVLKQGRTLAAAGHEVHFVVPDPPVAQFQGIRLHHFERPAGTRRPARIARRLAAMYRQATALQADVYHFHDPELIPVGLLLKRTGARVVYDVHEDTRQEELSLRKDRPWWARLRGGVWALLEGAAGLMLDAFVCATPTIARHFPPRRTVTVQNFPLVEDAAEHRPAYQSRPPRLAYVGGLTAIRGVREMVRTLEQLPASLGVRLTLAGRFDPPQLRAEMERLPGWRQVDFLGWLSAQQVRAVLTEARAGLVVLHPEPIYLQAQPVKLFEYMAAGLPVIASDFPAWRKIIRGVGCGLLVDPLDPAAIARAADYLLTHPHEAETMGQRGRQAVRDFFNWDREADKLLGLYQTLQRAA